MTLWGYNKRIRISIDSSGDGELTNYQKKITLVKGSGTSSGNTIYLENEALNWPYDIRFSTDEAGTILIDFWREEYDATDGTWWVEIPTVPASGGTTIHLHVGDADATDASDGDATLIMFDDFPGSSLDTDKWDLIQGNVGVASGELVLTSTTGTLGKLMSDAAFSVGTELRVKFRGASDVITNTHIASMGDDPSKAQWIGFYGGSSANVLSTLAGKNSTYNSVGNVSVSDISTGLQVAVQRVSGKISWIDVTNGNTVLDTETNATYIPTADLKIYLQEGGVAGQVGYIDWIFVRNYTEDEPEISATKWMIYKTNNTIMW